MNENRLKELFQEEKYQEVIDLIKKEYEVLFKEMLKFKEAEYDECDDFYILSSRIPLVYPEYSDKILRLGNCLMNPEETYLDVINCMLNIYESMKNGYKEESDYSEDMWVF